MHKVQETRNKVMGKNMRQVEPGVELPCPEGYDALKWAALSLKEKLKVLGISEKEWSLMTREQQMKRMNKLAHGFHFYSMNKK